MPLFKPKSKKNDDVSEHYSGIADAILAKKKMAEGGEVEMGDMEDPSKAFYDDLNEDAVGPMPDSLEEADSIFGAIKKSRGKRGK